MKDICYRTLDPVLKTWDDARFSTKNFDEEFAMVCLEKFFEINPKGKTVFGHEPHEVLSREKVGMHGRLFASVFDSIFQMLGPDKEFIEEMLSQVGRRHRMMRIAPEFFPDMGIALIHTVEHCIKRKLTPHETNCWAEVYDALSTELIMYIHDKN